MRVKDIMTKPVITISSQAPLAKALDLLIDQSVSGLPVVDEAGQLCGILSEGDLLRRMELGTADRPQHWWERLFTMNGAETYRLANGRKVSDVMSASPITIDDTASLAEAAGLMEKHRIKRLPVLHDGQLVGLLSRADFVRALRKFVAPTWEKPAISDEEIKNHISTGLRQQLWATDCSFEVFANEGRVTLKGIVTTDDQRRAARVLAENVIGVRSVDEQILVVEPVLMPPL